MKQKFSADIDAILRGGTMGLEVLGLYLERPARRSSWIEGVLWALRIQRLEGSRPAREPMGFVCG